MPLHKDADIWTLARATQLLDSSDPIIRHICRQQLEETIIEKYKDVVQQPLPISEFLSGSMTNGLFEVRYGGGRQNLWTRARRAAIYTNVQIDVSSELPLSWSLMTSLSFLQKQCVVSALSCASATRPLYSMPSSNLTAPKDSHLTPPPKTSPA